MKLDHINLSVRDVVEASGFLKRHFGYRDLFEDNNAGMVALEDGSGLSVLLMKGAHATYPKYFHIGFDVETTDRVDAMHAALVADGMEIEAPHEVAWGSYTFHFTVPGGDFTIEVACATGEWA